jgi:hypothetical protein
MVNVMVKASLHGIMGRYLKGNGGMAKRMVLVCGNHPREIHMKANGKITDRLVQVSIFTLEARSIMDSSKIF